jgi:hypothetical protein
VGDNPDNKTIRMQFRHGEADTVYSNGPFEDHVPRKWLGKSNLDSMIAAGGFNRFNPSCGVDVPLHNVPIEPAICEHRSLQIDYIPRLKVSQIGSP